MKKWNGGNHQLLTFLPFAVLHNSWLKFFTDYLILWRLRHIYIIQGTKLGFYRVLMSYGIMSIMKSMKILAVINIKELEVYRVDFPWTWALTRLFWRFWIRIHELYFLKLMDLFISQINTNKMLDILHNWEDSPWKGVPFWFQAILLNLVRNIPVKYRNSLTQ